MLNAQISMLTAANDKAIADLNAEISTLTTEKEIVIVKLKNFIIDLEKLVMTLKQTWLKNYQVLAPYMNGAQF